MSKLILTVGLPRAGKSTWAKRQGHPVVCPDAVRLAMHGEAFNPQAEPWVWTMVYTMVHALFYAGHEIVIVDATNVTAKRRVEWSKQFRSARVELKIFSTLPMECIRRARQGKRDDLVPVIERMAKNWDLERPDGWDEREPWEGR